MDEQNIPHTNVAVADSHEDDEDDTEMTVEELALSNDAIQDALVELLIQKGIITEQELNDKIEELDKAEDEELAEEAAEEGI